MSPFCLRFLFLNNAKYLYCSHHNNEARSHYSGHHCTSYYRKTYHSWCVTQKYGVCHFTWVATLFLSRKSDALSEAASLVKRCFWSDSCMAALPLACFLCRIQSDRQTSDWKNCQKHCDSSQQAYAWVWVCSVRAPNEKQTWPSSTVSLGDISLWQNNTDIMVLRNSKKVWVCL